MSTDRGSSGSPILKLSSQKIIGIHKEGVSNHNYNRGTLLKYPINEYINKINNEIKLKNELNNQKNNIFDQFGNIISKNNYNNQNYYLNNNNNNFNNNVSNNLNYNNINMINNMNNNMMNYNMNNNLINNNMNNNMMGNMNNNLINNMMNNNMNKNMNNNMMDNMNNNLINNVMNYNMNKNMNNNMMNYNMNNNLINMAKDINIKNNMNNKKIGNNKIINKNKDDEKVNLIGFIYKKYEDYFPLIGLEKVDLTPLNSILQCLLHIPELNGFFINKYLEHKDKLKKINNKSETAGRLCEEYHKVVLDILKHQDAKKNSVITKNFNNFLCNINGQFSEYGENDVKDLLLHLLQMMHEELNYFGDQKLKNTPRCNKSIEVESFYYFMTINLNLNLSIISYLFYGILKSKTICKGCENIIYDFQDFKILSFPT